MFGTGLRADQPLFLTDVRTLGDSYWARRQVHCQQRSRHRQSVYSVRRCANNFHRGEHGKVQERKGSPAPRRGCA